MARLLEHDATIDADYDDKTELQSDIDKIENDILNEFNASSDDIKWTMKVYRAGNSGKIDAHLFDCSPSDLPINDRLRENYGTGNYLARVYKNGKLLRVLHFAVEAPKADHYKTDPGMSAVAQALQNQARLLESLINKQHATPVASPSLDMGNILSTVATLMSAFKEMMPPPPPPSNTMDMFIKGIELAKEFSASDKESNFIDIIRDVLKSGVLSDIAKNISVSPETRKSVPASLPAPQKTAPVLARTDNKNADPEIAGLAQYLDQFVRAAENGSDPLLYADLVLDNVDENVLKHLFSKSNFEDKLQEYDEKIKANWLWFKTMINAIQAGLEETDSDNASIGTADKIE